MFINIKIPWRNKLPKVDDSIYLGVCFIFKASLCYNCNSDNFICNLLFENKENLNNYHEIQAKKGSS